MHDVVFNSVSCEKDVDGFHDANVAKLARGTSGGFIPCTPLGICRLLQEYQIGIAGRHVVIIGRGNLVGRPLSLLLSRKLETMNATVTLCHSQTNNLEVLTKIADVIVVAIGRKFFLRRSMINPGVVVIDAGTNREYSDRAHNTYAIFGDSDFDNIKDLCSAITPVPGGVGPMTVAMLMQNTLTAAKRQSETTNYVANYSQTT
jgi:methylenetetrahydrofolate dehydrogenase (NADP+)/methenyltetrahydrofolate cyclohydrolase